MPENQKVDKVVGSNPDIKKVEKSAESSPNGDSTIASAESQKPTPAELSSETTKKTPRSGVITELRQLQQDVVHYKKVDLVVPILSLVFLALLTVFVYIPMISDAVEFRKEKADVEEKIAKLERVNSEISKIDVGLLQQDLAVARSVIPFSLQVSDFVLYINELALEKKLEFREIVAGDIQIREKGEARDKDPVIKGVSGPLKYVGTLDRITGFLSDLQNSSPYVISSDNIEIRDLGEESMWEVSLLITGYYLNRTALPTPEIYQPFSGYSQFQSIVDIFRKKSESFEN